MRKSVPSGILPGEEESPRVFVAGYPFRDLPSASPLGIDI